MKKKNILLISFIFIIIFSIIVVKPLGNLDEIWNYNTARTISEGLIPYKEISMITTPFLPIITAIFLKIFTNEILVSRILAALLWTGILFMMYKILKNLIKDENASLIFTALIGILCRDIYCIDYNAVSLFIVLIILYLELINTEKNNKKDKENINQINPSNDKINNILKYNKKHEILIGILVGLTICTKQSIGAILAIISVGYKLLFVRNSEEFKQYLKVSFTRILGILIPGCILLTYLLISGSFTDFLNYAVLGIKTFSNKIKYSNLLQNDKFEIRFLVILLPISAILISIELIVNTIKESKKSKNTLDNNEQLKLLILLFYSLSMIITMYPISDEIHFLVGSLIAFIGTLYLIFIVCKNNKKNIKLKQTMQEKTKKKIYKTYIIITDIICIILFMIILKKATTNLYNYTKVEKNKTIKHYKNIEISEGLSNRITQIDNYIIEQEKYGKKVYIVDAEAAIYMIPLDKYNKNYDMFLKGNIGKDGEEGIINEIKNSKENCLYLVMKPKYYSNWQTPTKVVNYIKNNLNLIDEITIFNVYEKFK